MCGAPLCWRSGSVISSYALIVSAHIDRKDIFDLKEDPIASAPSPASTLAALILLPRHPMASLCHRGRYITAIAMFVLIHQPSAARFLCSSRSIFGIHHEVQLRDSSVD